MSLINTDFTNFVIVMSHGHWPASKLAITEACGVDVLLFLPSLFKTKKWKWIRDAQWACEAACGAMPAALVRWKPAAQLRRTSWAGDRTRWRKVLQNRWC